MKVKKIETPYFKHSFQARNDKKLDAVFAEFDLAGIGLYWIIVETLYCENGILPLSYTKVLVKKWHASEDMVDGLLNLKIGDKSLFKKNDTHFWCDGVNERLEEIKKRIEVSRNNANKRWHGNDNEEEQQCDGTPKGSKKGKGKGKKSKNYIKLPDTPLVNLTQDELETLKTKYSEDKTLMAIKIFNNWLEKRGKTAKNYIGKAHYAHFKVDGWVWDEADKSIQKEVAKNGTSSEYGKY